MSSLKDLVHGAVQNLRTRRMPITDASEKRLALCRACTDLNDETDRCQLCGCPVALKVRDQQEYCPTGRW